MATPETMDFQTRVGEWMNACFGPAISFDGAERNHRFLEEALELVQARGCSVSEAHQLVDYVFGRPVGEQFQEVGGVMVTLAALCLEGGVEMAAAGGKELARVWTKIDRIRAKQATKPKHSPLPEEAATDLVLDAAEALLAGEVGVLAHLHGNSDPEFEPWPAMDALMKAMDQARPGWRQRAVAP
jgi:hypothetical protein